MAVAEIGLTRTLRWIAAGIALTVAVSLPLGYWLVVYSFVAEETVNDAAAHAQLVTRRINENPELWRFEIPRLDAIVAAHHGAGGSAEKHAILDEHGAVLSQNVQSLSPPSLSRAAPLLDSGTVVGQFVTSRSLLAELQNTALVGLFSVLLALAVYVSLSVLPLRALTRTLGALGHERERLRASVQELRLFADNVPAMTVSFDENLRCRFANKRYAEFFGFNPADMIGKHLNEIVEEGGYREVEGYFVQVLQGRPVTYQRTRKLPNGETRYLEVKLLPHIGEGGQAIGCFVVTTDITDHKLVEERIQRVAHHDSLTGLPNRLLFNDRLQQAVSLAKRDSRQFALLYLDLDGFKQVNDSLGHTAGDELLQAVAVRIRLQVRESDTVARIGGDEFTVILSDVARPEEAEIVARKIIAALAKPFQPDSQQRSVEIGSSIGIAIYPSNAGDADALVRAADSAMYNAKQQGNSLRFCDVR